MHPFNLERTRAHGKTAVRARKAAKALLAADLADLAQPHIKSVAQVGLQCLQILSGEGESGNLDYPSDSFGTHPDLAAAVSRLLAVEASDGKASTVIPDLFNRIEAVLLSDH